MLLWNEKNGKGREDTLNDGIAERIRIREKKKKTGNKRKVKRKLWTVPTLHLQIVFNKVVYKVQNLALLFSDGFLKMSFNK